MIDTYVGGGNGDGAPAIDALIDPRGVTFVAGPTGADAYIADGRNNRVRRVDGATGIITTVAGNGTRGFSGDGGPAQNASLSLPLDVAVDGLGNLYIADYDNNRIRKVTPNGIISTFAGNGNLTYAGDNGPAVQASLYNPWGVAVGPDGYVYIADFGNNRIRKVGPPNCTPSTCIITTVVGTGTWGYGGDNGPALNAILRNPSDVAFDAAGNMLISDWGNHRLRKVSNGIITAVAGGGTIGSGGSIGDGGPAVGAVLRYPAQVTAGAGDVIYVTDTQQRRLRRISGGIITTLAGTGTAGDAGDGGPAVEADMYLPYGVAVNQSGDVWIATTTDLARSQHNRVRRVRPSLIIDSVVGGGFGDGAAASDVLVDPRGGDAVAGEGPLPDLYFADGANNLIRYVDGSDGTIHVLAGTGESGYDGDGGLAVNAKLRIPLDVAVDGSGNVYIADTSNHAVRRVDRNGIITTVAGTGFRGFSGDNGPATQAQLANPNGVAVDASGALYIADFNNHRIRKVVNGIITTVAGNGQAGYGGDNGPATAASLRNPWDVVVASDGTLYISDTFNYRIRRVAPNGIITTYAGIGLSGFTGDGGPATSARLDTPSLLALDSANNLFINDSQNGRVRVVDATSKIIQTVAGNGQSGVSGDGGPATAASFSDPTGVAVAPSGSYLFISSKDDGRVRLVAFGGASIPEPTATPTPTFTSVPSLPTHTATRTHTPTRTATPTRTPTGGAAIGGISGRITYYSSGLAVSNVRVGLLGPQQLFATSNASGNYAAANLPLGGWAVEPARTGSVGSSVSSLDAARVLQAIAGLTLFNPMQRLACDVTGDGNLSALDAVRILQYSAGVIEVLPLAQTCGSDWLFYPTPSTFPLQDIITPLMGSGTCQPGTILLTLAGGALTASGQDFEGLVIGDCTGNWSPAIGGALRRGAASSATVHAGPLRAAPGRRYRLPLYVQSTAPFVAVDVTLAYDPAALTVRAVHPHGEAVDALVETHSPEPGLLSISLASGVPLDGSHGALLMVELGGGRDAAGAEIDILRATVDEQPAGVASQRAR